MILAISFCAALRCNGCGLRSLIEGLGLFWRSETFDVLVLIWFVEGLGLSGEFESSRPDVGLADAGTSPWCPLNIDSIRDPNIDLLSAPDMIRVCSEVHDFLMCFLCGDRIGKNLLHSEDHDHHPTTLMELSLF